MLPFPSFKHLTTPEDITTFSTEYTRCSGFNVQPEYYKSNRVFAIRYNGRMIGGFVLGAGKVLRTLEVFAGNEAREMLYAGLQQSDCVTEICCFWIDPSCRKKTSLNWYVWFCVAYALQVYGGQRLIFGTNSARLAALYGASQKGELIHRDQVHQKQTFIFTGRRQDSLMGIFNILCYKFSRMVDMARSNRKPLLQF